MWSTGATTVNIKVRLPGNYWLSVIDGNNCTGIDSVVVFSKNCLTRVFIPNSFTPNGDGKNDIFKAIVVGQVLSFNLVVYDRLVT